MTPVELSRTVLRAVRRAVDEGELRVAVPERAVVTAPGPGGCGDYATNIALQLARPAGQPPRDVAEILQARLLGSDGVADVVITGPGFLNISLGGTASVALVEEILGRGTRYGYADGPSPDFVQLSCPHEVRAVVVMDAAARIMRSQGALVRTRCDAGIAPRWADILGVRVEGATTEGVTGEGATGEGATSDGVRVAARRRQQLPTPPHDPRATRQAPTPLHVTIRPAPAPADPLPPRP
ncbi:putative Arginyl-tRNA synthetase [Streptomyces viridochromogenes Tue57]|uniref:Putative Arginyl-tRNA synthetase n=1 Tax=Streptomyces viridochromogenes Tue57 TaxID=1160705 RepID=L8PM62_STRVR|nr:putative Arginyl-tRNA synthetase [Streptomyces viridochromogenes Tue57]